MNITQNAYIKINIVKGLGDSPIAKALFGDVRWAWLWLLLRLYLGWEWLQAGWGKLHNPGWNGYSGFCDQCIDESKWRTPGCSGLVRLVFTARGAYPLDFLELSCRLGRGACGCCPDPGDFYRCCSFLRQLHELKLPADRNGKH
jgi:hypothetical protein